MDLPKQFHWKDVTIGILVAYVAIDLLMSCMMKAKMPSALEKMSSAVSTSSGLWAVVIGLVLGLAAWYFSSRTKEYFKHKEERV